MVSQKLLNELDQIMKDVYQLTLSPYDLSNLANSLVDYYATLIEVIKKDNHE